MKTYMVFTPIQNTQRMNQATSVVPTVLFPHKGSGSDIGWIRPYINPKPCDEALWKRSQEIRLKKVINSYYENYGVLFYYLFHIYGYP